MNAYAIKQIIVKIQNLDRDIAELERVRVELASNGYASATVSSSGGSKSYTRQDIAKVSELLAQLRA